LKRAALILLLACSVAAGAQLPRQEVSIQQRMIVFEGDGSRLKVNELYTVQNNAVASGKKTTPRALEIYLPAGAAVEQATARSEGGKSVKTAIVPKAEKNRYAFTYPLGSGKSQFAVTYTLPYSGHLRIKPRVTAPTGHLLLVAPDSMRLVPEDASVLAPANDPMLKNVSVLVAGNVTPQVNLGFEIQGTGSLARAKTEGKAPAPTPRSAVNNTSRSGDEAGSPEQPSATPATQWIFLAVLVLFMAAGATYVYAANSAAAPPVAASPSLPSQPAAIKDEVKEEILQLELDRLQGKLSPEEYEAAKAVLDKAIRRAVERAERS